MTPYPTLMGLLGREDVHPGGAAASEALLDALGEPAAGARIVDLGAGAGGTTKRLVRRGWEVIAVEPDADLRGVLLAQGLDGRDGRAESLDAVVGERAVDAVIAESVLYLTDLERAFAGVRRALVPGGRLAFVDMVWVPGVTAAAAAAANDRAVARFAIGVATPRNLTWTDWTRLLDEAGFDVVFERRLGNGAQGHASRVHVRTALPALLRRPSLARDALRTAWRTRTDPRVPARDAETWMCIARVRG